MAPRVDIGVFIISSGIARGIIGGGNSSHVKSRSKRLLYVVYNDMELSGVVAFTARGQVSNGNVCNRE